MALYLLNISAVAQDGGSARQECRRRWLRRRRESSTAGACWRGVPTGETFPSQCRLRGVPFMARVGVGFSKVRSLNATLTRPPAFRLWESASRSLGVLSPIAVAFVHLTCFCAAVFGGSAGGLVRSSKHMAGHLDGCIVQMSSPAPQPADLASSGWWVEPGRARVSTRGACLGARHPRPKHPSRNERTSEREVRELTHYRRQNSY